MSDLMVIDIGRNALLTVLYLSGPMLLLSMVVGLAISIFQAATQINEMTLTFIPKLLTIGISLIVFLPWMMNKFQVFFFQLMVSVSNVSGM
jgi:flagellar biosynthetic protein FliQ